MKKLLLIVCCIGALSLHAQSPNWSQDIAPIFYAKCTNCHNPKGVAPFSLINYMDGYYHAIVIQKAVATNYMPPWPPDTGYRHLAHERILSQDQISAIVTWVNNGAPSG